MTIASNFPNIIPQAEIRNLDDEWRELQFTDPSDLLCTSSDVHHKDVVTYWGTISQMVDLSQEKRFPTISKLTTSLL